MSPNRRTKMTFVIRPGLFTVSLVIKNVGNITAFNVGWSIIAKGGFILFGINSSEELSQPLPPNQEMNITSHFFLFGFGRIKIIYAVWAENAPMVSTEIHGILLIWFFKMNFKIKGG